MIVWNPQKQNLTQVDEDLPLDELQALVNGYIQGFNIDGIPCYINEEARIDSSQFFAKTIFPDGTIIFGNIIFLTNNKPKVQLALENVEVKLKDTLN